MTLEKAKATQTKILTDKQYQGRKILTCALMITEDETDYYCIVYFENYKLNKCSIWH
jgi:hypothetical protein